MLTATDSFIEFLDSSLDGEPEVYWWRQTAVDEHAGLLKLNALNVSILGFYGDGSTEMALVSLDLLADDERKLLTWLRTVRDLLRDTQIVLEFDYTGSPAPVATGRTLSWDGNYVRFLSVRAPRGTRYTHYNATFPLLYSRAAIED